MELLAGQTSSASDESPHGIFQCIQPQQVLLKDTELRSTIQTVSTSSTSRCLSWVFPIAPHIHYEFFVSVAGDVAKPVVRDLPLSMHGCQRLVTPKRLVTRKRLVLLFVGLLLSYWFVCL